MTEAQGSVAIIHDMPEEGWPSMDQMGELLTTRLPALAPRLVVTPIRHHLTRVFSGGPLGRIRPLFSADRVLNRMLLYPRKVKRAAAERFDVYHIVDHSYAQLALELPARRTIVSCHDVDTFRSLVQPDRDPRNPLFNAMTRRIAAGLRRAELIVCVSAAARDDLLQFKLADPARLRLVPNGIDPALLEDPPREARARAAELLPPQDGAFDVLHVGNDIPRKRLDRLLEIVAALRQRGHRIRLVRVGSPLRHATRQRMNTLGLGEVVELPFVQRDVLRALYERCGLLLLTSDREGYGLPVLEAFAAGKPVVASDIPALRESSGGLARLVAPDSLHEWVAAIEDVMRTTAAAGALADQRRAHAAARTWDSHIRGLLPVYQELLSRQQS
jgi:glycosyltransferase involved in cell wall biosynthesis